MWFNISKWNDFFLLDPSSFHIRSKLDENFRIYDSRVYLLRQFELPSPFSTCFPISFPVYQKLILSRFVARSKHEIVLPILKKKEETNIANIISIQTWRKNMEYGYFNRRESLWSTKYIEKFRPFFYSSLLFNASSFYLFIFNGIYTHVYILCKYFYL